MKAFNVSYSQAIKEDWDILNEMVAIDEVNTDHNDKANNDKIDNNITKLLNG